MAKRRRVPRLRRDLRPTEKIVVKNARGQFRKHRADLKVVLYVVNKKTGKVVGTKNMIKNGKPVSRRFSKAQLAHISVPRAEPGFEVQERGEGFRVYSTKPIVHQIPGALTTQVKKLAKKSHTGTIIVSFEIFYKRDFHLFSKGLVFDGTERIADVRMRLAKLIIDTLYAINVRISPKAYSERKKNSHRRYIDVIPQFS